MLATLYSGLQGFFALLMSVLVPAGPVIALIIVSVLLGIMLILAYGKLSAQEKIAGVKRNIAANILESVLFRHDLKICLAAQIRAMGLSFKYAGLAIPPLIALALPTVIVLGQLYPYFGLRGLAPGETAIVTAKVTDRSLLNSISLAGEGLSEITPPVRMESLDELSWRVKAADGGDGKILINSDDKKLVEVPLLSSSKTAPSINGLDSWDTAWLYGSSVVPGELANSISRVSISYPERNLHWLGISWNWLVLFFVVSMIAGLVMSRVAKIEI